MDSSEAVLDRIEAQGSADDQRKQRCFPMNLIKKGARTFNSQASLESGGECTPLPNAVPEYLTNLILSDLYNLPGEYVPMTPEIFSAMRGGNIEFLEKMKSYGTPMPYFKNDKGDSILHLVAAWGHVELVKVIVSECPYLLLELNSKDQLPLHVAAHAGHLTVVEALVATITFFSAKLSDEEEREKLNLYVLKDRNGDTALHLALKDLHKNAENSMYQKQITLLQFLSHRIRAGSIPDTSTRQMETAACLVKANQHASFLANKDGVSPLYMAIEASSVSLVSAMLNHPGNNVQGKTSNLVSQLEGRKSLVHAALKAKNTDVLDVILNEDPSLVNERDEEGRTCLSVGAFVGFSEGICKLLDRSTSNVYECDTDGSFSIHKAVEKGHMDIVKMLLKSCPDSKYLINKQGQNILHIAAKNGKAKSSLLGYIRKFDTKYRLMEEQDVDGNTPLHLASINWRPRTLISLTEFALTNPKILNMQNKDGLRPLDIAELNLQSDYILRERMTLMVLMWIYAPRGVAWMLMSGMTLRSRSEHHLSGGNKYKDHINVLLLVAALVATMTFAAGFTMPGGFSSSAPNLGMAILANDRNLFCFLVCDTVAMQCSIVALVSLIWAQLGDPELIHRALRLALPSLFFALVSMSLAFIFGVLTTIKHNKLLFIVIYAISGIFYNVMLLLLAPYIIPQRYIGVFIPLLLWVTTEDDAENTIPLALVKRE